MKTDTKIIIYCTNNLNDKQNIMCPSESRSGCACRLCSRTRYEYIIVPIIIGTCLEIDFTIIFLGVWGMDEGV